MQAELVSLSSNGKLRVTYNWLYSALNCDPNDNSTFLWDINSLGGSNVSLSPDGGYGGKTLYASVRDDNKWYVQTQAPFSADWITAVGRDETISMQTHDLGILSFSGFNGKYIALNGSPTHHGGHSGYLLQSNSSNPTSKDTLWFPKISGAAAQAAQVDLGTILKTFNITLTQEEYDRLSQQIS